MAGAASALSPLRASSVKSPFLDARVVQTRRGRSGDWENQISKLLTDHWKKRNYQTVQLPPLHQVEFSDCETAP